MDVPPEINDGSGNGRRTSGITESVAAVCPPEWGSRAGTTGLITRLILNGEAST
jgi:hypothetical protein